MTSPTIRRPLPALIALLALLLLTGIVWWRVVARGDDDNTAQACPSPSATASQPATLPAPASITVQVANSTTRAGLAGKVRTQLQQYGFQVAKAINDPIKKKNPQTAQIRYTASGKQGATLLRYYFPGSTAVAVSGTSPIVVVALGEKYRSVATPSTVAAALRGDNLTTASAAPTTTAAGPTSTCTPAR